MYNNVLDWTKKFGLFVADKPTFHNSESRELRYNLSKEELEEYKDAKNIVDVADAIGDRLWLVLGDCIHHGLDPEKLIQAIYNSNMSKLCYNLNEVHLTRLSYLDKNIDTHYKDNGDGTFTIFRSSDNKVMKSINFKEPDFSSLFK